MNFKYQFALIFLLGISENIISQNPCTESNKGNVVLNYSIAHVLFSDSVQDSFYIFIKLPKFYNEETDKSYPVIFLLDGDIAFPIGYSVVRYLQYGRFVPDVIIVGVGYGGLMDGSKIPKRERDYAISSIEQWKDSGSAREFLNFLKYELIPFLESDYRIDGNSLTLSGHSLGGLFTLYTLFSEPQLFKNYIASSPYTSLDVNELLLLEDKNREKIERANCRLFISFGSKEDNEKYVVPNTRILDHIRQRGADYIDLKFRIFEAGVHFSTPAEAMAYGLMHAFN